MMNTSRNLARIFLKNQKTLWPKSKGILDPGLDVKFNSFSSDWSRSVHYYRTKFQPHHSVQPRIRVSSHHKLLLKYRSSDTQSGGSDSGSRKGGKGDHEGGPVCPRCKEPFSSTLSAISKFSMGSVVHSLCSLPP